MKIHLGSDHAGFELKEIIKERLHQAGHETVDHGALTFDPGDAYPAYCFACAKATLQDEGSLGIVLGGSGNGEQIAANKIKGVRAALVWNLETAVLSRQHNNAQVMALGARQTSPEDALKFVDTFIQTPFEGGRHSERIAQLEDENLIAEA